MEAPQLPALCLGNDCQSGGHTSVVITPETDAVCSEAEDGERAWRSDARARVWLPLGQWRWLSALNL